MTRRIKTACLVAPNGIYIRTAFEAHGYRTSENARFAVVRASETAPWLIVHRASGGNVSSVIPATARKVTLAELLAVVAAWEAATHLDWSAFDALPAVTPESGPLPPLNDRARPTVVEMRELAAIAVA